IWYKGIPKNETKINKQTSEQFQEIVAREKFRFLELCKKDVTLNEAQTEVLKEVLGKTFVGAGKNNYLPGESLIAEEHADLLLVAATYVNSL
ncbi:hypothetical protein MUP35_00415, partial [Patescibacteria group bacterium]|nr:hypothetical protein [Patescibacteria group bacterium]